MSKDIIAVFDFDGTLVRWDSFLKFAVYSRGKLRTVLALIEAIPLLLMWKLRFMGAERPKRKVFSRLYKGLEADQLRKHGGGFASVIIEGENPEVMKRFRRHLADGHRVLIISASPSFWIEPWAKAQGVEKVIATEAEEDGTGKLTGNFATPNCKGKEKVRRLREYLGHHRGAEIWSYSDSRSDYPLFAESSYAFMVKGDRMVPLEFSSPDAK